MKTLQRNLKTVAIQTWISLGVEFLERFLNLVPTYLFLACPEIKERYKIFSSLLGFFFLKVLWHFKLTVCYILKSLYSRVIFRGLALLAVDKEGAVNIKLASALSFIILIF